MNIAVLCFHALGGSGVVACEIGRELGRRGHQLHFVAGGLPERLDPLPPRVTFHAVPLEEGAPVGGLGFPVALAARLTEVCRSERIDLIHAHYAVPHAAAAALARTALGAGAPRLVVTLHGTDVPSLQAGEGRALMVRSLVLAADAVTSPSRALAAQARERLDLPETVPLEVVPNFVDVSRFRPGAESERATLAQYFPAARPDWQAVRVLCHASNFRPVKRALEVLRVFERVRKERPALLLFAGDGPERPLVQDEARKAGLAHEVAFTGPCKDLAPILRACDLFLLPSSAESFGLAALEAMSSGVPVLATRVGGLPEVVGDGEGGLLFALGAEAAMAAAAARLLDDPRELARLGRGARDRAVKLFTAPPVVERWEMLYERVLAGR